ncbi:MAG: hypothetical protein MPI95_04035 [Nitrosopumilus sp.]|nr:hypothetical protein [Nitrosopumilus sp.]CAI9831971.1 conserved hypothetical protein [Nitrosopumilaceae archaeon]MDA7941747.1 hypothetical protein [Nitrosopumilus sp.]MDA7943718.1 hypothetical protein [Nitrosopumilus sp.]MDA7945629.1 hypothetical protein [Nitrosopumilus sp.]
MEYVTRYPRTVAIQGGRSEEVKAGAGGVEQLHIVVRRSFEDLARVFAAEGFTKVKLEHKRPGQIGSGLNLKLKKPWELHVRMVDLKKGLIGIHAEVEVSRDYLQHLFSQRTPVVYEVAEILKKYQVEYGIWHGRIRGIVDGITNNYRVRLASPAIPVFAWKPMLFVIGTIGGIYGWKYLNTIFG